MKNMRNIKPTALQGRAKLDRMKQLMGESKQAKQPQRNFKIELTKLGPDNVVYGIVREGHEYYIKTANKVENLMLEDFNYVGGLKNKKSNAFKSYSAAMRKLNLKMISLNEQYGGDKVDVFSDDKLLKESFNEEDLSNEFVEEAVGEECTCPSKDCGACGTIEEGELKVDNVHQDGPKELPANAIGDHKEVTMEPDDAVNDNETGTETEGNTKATPKKTIGEGKKRKCAYSILNAMEKMDSIIESLDTKKKDLTENLNELEMDQSDVNAMTQRYEESFKSKVQPITVEYYDMYTKEPSGEKDILQPRVRAVGNAKYGNEPVGQSDGSMGVTWKGERQSRYIDVSGWSGNVDIGMDIGTSARLDKESINHIIMLMEELGNMFDVKVDVHRIYDQLSKKGNVKLRFGANGYLGESKKKSLTETKYKLKVDDPTPEPKEPSFDSGSGASFDEEMPSEDPFADAPDAPQDAPAPEGEEGPWDDEPFDAGIDVDEEEDPKNFLEKLSGKIGQSLREYSDEHGIDLSLEKFILNSVISATHTAQMDDSDRDDIIDKINSSGDGGEDENDSEEPSIEQPPATGENPTNPAPAADGGAPMGEGIEILPKEHKQVFKNAKLGVTEGFGEGQFTGSPVSTEEEEFNGDDDWERVSREVENDYMVEDENEETTQNDLEVSDEKDIFDDKQMKQMILDYLMNHQGGDVAPAPVKEPVEKPAPTKKPRRKSPYRINRPLPNPTPKASNE